ncbi:MAG: bifunctional protein-serine/threonine kinase/phosphatase [gamma proteobacterium symbiont of Bathyaustriella thionipta]|nr:bifunctional protein-serine/threonine kinase/phosphatase [gamma proteobacterium symbiont of Bathyaustriella thionipta]MCU7948813.1 bifunctional protein-serine/threonine kinase/phosphatase [gamma proteobacterium symbiont of Bathyaustriella thionipta]MCU7954225.1 bifunctional protein-serine/threonine kinase/phosphatase [gamma proteobacterium symbiont of Bathyaustriella thionipta]MCU7955271.1 bifunctional protein-serine/threonine kinase/phosphatase [gamma proteobacterium symbiont of Bathyaustrie
MKQKLEISIASYSDKGIKNDNDDCLAFKVPGNHALKNKGIVIAIADGMSSSEAGKEASHACINGFINDYYSTPDSWIVQNSTQKILSALNSWLYSRGHTDYQSARGMVTTLTILILKSTTAHIFHIGDSRIYRLRDEQLEQLTRDHRVWISDEKNYLNRAMGIDLHLDIDYRKVPLEKDDLFLLSTDGIHDFISSKSLRETLNSSSAKNYNSDLLTQKCHAIAQQAIDNQCDDNLSLQLLKIDNLPLAEEKELLQKAHELPFPPSLEPGMIFDGYKILKEIHASNRTHIYSALHQQTNHKVILKIPSINFEDDEHFIEQFLHEEWAGKRIESPYVLQVIPPIQKPRSLYYVTEFLEGITLREWMKQNPLPSIDIVIPIVEQIAKGLRAFHRLEMLHQDLKPENIIISPQGKLKIIDFGSVKIAGIYELKKNSEDDDNLLGTVNYSAPEFYLGQSGGERSDLYSLAVITYELLNNSLPFGKEMPEKANFRQLSQLKYVSSIHLNPMVPNWMDGAIKKALSLDIKLRHEDVFEFLHDLKNPNPHFVNTIATPLIERNPVLLWRSTSIVLFITNLILFYYLVK